jgi:RNA polymerase sigma-70 factor (ECF subfamily)
MEWVTTTQVLEELQSSNDAPAWRRFCDHFHIVVVNFSKHMGLSITDAEDVAQETMLAFVKAFRDGKYDRDKGHLSDWLFGIAKHVILNFRRRLPSEQLVADKTTGTSFLDQIQDDRNIKLTWETEWRHMVLTRCFEQARKEFNPKVFKAFELYALSQTAADKVAQQLEMSQNAVYIAKCRVLSRLRELEGQFE